ncbi:anticodon nuclease [Acinetobacter sp. ANC 4633]|uniref:AAA family ATPase n=1 Tax=Acinetobacter sp. ANC 4633 TaxID=2529845 RepID=UPI00103BC3A1|nr:AAA family ATPase [Acinetobacter sp. ANC 4633]TCB27123.1 anticodon nuclease [Acinetobacter sp. ANC 4633]
MSSTRNIRKFTTLSRLVTCLRDDLNGGANNFLLIYAYNGTGKTRLSMEFKQKGKTQRRGDNTTTSRDTLYFNAFTEDLFRWDNDLASDTSRKLHLNSDSRFFSGFQELALEEKIYTHLEKYADFDFRIDYQNWAVSFSRVETVRLRGQTEPTTRTIDDIKVSRGEENLFIWCTFLAICELAIDQQEAYNWVKYIYIDDPISSLDENNVIALASDLAKILRTCEDKIKVVISTHHGLFFNIMNNELKKHDHKCYFLYKNKHTNEYQLQSTGDTPFFYHVAMLKELKDASDANPCRLYTYHFNILRSIMEKTASFFGFEDFSSCVNGIENEALFSRALNLLSHGKYSAYEPQVMGLDNQQLFKNILDAFLQRYPFQLPNIGEVIQPTTSTSPQTDIPQEIQT